MRKLLLFAILVLGAATAKAQSEPNDMVTYDTTIHLGVFSFIARVTRPQNGDTLSRPAIFMMPGEGEMGPTADSTKAVVYGPHYWMKNGWAGSVQMGNGTHYPIFVTLIYQNAVYVSTVAYYQIISFFLNTYHIKRNAVYLTGLSMGAFSAGGLIEFENTLGDQAGMKLPTAIMPFEGTPLNPSSDSPPRAQNCSTGWCDTAMYVTWAQKYHGRYFYLEGSGTDDFRDGWHYSEAMNRAVPNSAYFSYENLGGGGHCCWNSMYDPAATNWTCVGTLGPNNSGSQAGINQMGNYRPGTNVYQWLLEQGDSSLVGGTPAIPNKPPVAIITNPLDTVTQAADSLRLYCAGSYDPDGTIVSYGWVQTSGPITAATTFNSDNSVWVHHMANGVYTFRLTVTDNQGATASATATVVQRYVSIGCPPARTVTGIQVLLLGTWITLPAGVTKLTYSDGTTQQF